MHKEAKATIRYSSAMLEQSRGVPNECIYCLARTSRSKDPSYVDDGAKQ